MRLDSLPSQSLEIWYGDMKNTDEQWTLKSIRRQDPDNYSDTETRSSLKHPNTTASFLVWLNDFLSACWTRDLGTSEFGLKSWIGDSVEFCPKKVHVYVETEIAIWVLTNQTIGSESFVNLMKDKG